MAVGEAPSYTGALLASLFHMVHVASPFPNMVVVAGHRYQGADEVTVARVGVVEDAVCAHSMPPHGHGLEHTAEVQPPGGEQTGGAWPSPVEERG